MKRVSVYIVIFLVLSGFQTPLLYAEDSVSDTEIRNVNGDINEVVDPADWGIYNGCISNNRIRAINVLGVNAAILELVDGKKVVMQFMGRCRGIRQYGFVYTTKNNLLCTKNHSVRVMETGNYCEVESLKPYLGDEPLGGDGKK